MSRSRDVLPPRAILRLVARADRVVGGGQHRGLAADQRIIGRDRRRFVGVAAAERGDVQRDADVPQGFERRDVGVDDRRLERLRGGGRARDEVRRGKRHREYAWIQPPRYVTPRDVRGGSPRLGQQLLQNRRQFLVHDVPCGTFSVQCFAAPRTSRRTWRSARRASRVSSRRARGTGSRSGWRRSACRRTRAPSGSASSAAL